MLAQIRPGQVFALANVHLTSNPYGPYLVRDGKTLAQVLANERSARVPEIRAAIRARRARARRGIPTLMTGDFNTPSHLDWTPAADAVARRHPLSRRVAGDPRAGGRRLPGRVPRRPPRPGREPGHHVDLRLPVPAPAGERGRRPDRPDPGVAAASRCSTRGSPGRPARPTSPSRSTRTRPTTAASSRACASCRPRRPRSRRCSTGGWSAATRSPCATRAPRGGGREHLAIVRAGGRPGAALMTLPPQEATFNGAVTFGSGGAARRAATTRCWSTPAAACCRAARSGSCGASAQPRIRVRRPVRAGPRDPHRLAQRARLPARLGRHLEGRRSRPLQRLPDVRLHRRDGGRRDADRGRPRRRSRPAATSPGC